MSSNFKNKKKGKSPSNGLVAKPDQNKKQSGIINYNLLLNDRN